jgi:outer membrane protein TolC
MRRIALLLVLALTIGVPSRVWAGQEPLTLDQALQATLDQNASLRAVRAAASEAEAQVTVARSVFFPRVSFNESWQRGNQPGFVFSSLLSARRFTAANFAIDGLNHPDALGFFRATVGVEQIVFDAGRRASTAAAGVRRDLASAATAEAALALSLASTEMFGRVLAAQAAAQTARAGRDAAREDLTRAQNRRDAGMATDADVLAFVVHVADLERRVIQADGDAAIARAELNRLMGAPIDRDFRAVEPAAAVSPAETPDVAALLAEAEASRPDLQRAAASERLADLGRRQARAAFIPTVAAHAAFDASGLRFNQRASGWFAGGELRWTFSTGGAELAQLKAAASGLTRARAERDDARAAVHVEVVAALRRLEAAQARQAAGRAAVEQAREAERIVRDRYEAGVASVSDVLRAATAVLDADANRSSALVDAIVSHAMLNRALGRRPL